MQDGQTSKTAQFVSILRAHHFLTAPSPKILNDSFALDLCGLSDAGAVEQYIEGMVQAFSAFADPQAAATFVKRIEWSVCMRSALVERALSRAEETGTRQVILLGAGLDTTAMRWGGLKPDIEFIELDHPDTQAHKISKLKEKNIAIPDNLRFVTFNFTDHTLGEALRKGGVDFNAPSLLPWLGVQMYLPDETVKATFSELSLFTKGSELIMDFAMPDKEHNDQIIPDSVEQLSKLVANMGEPFLSRYTQAQLSERLTNAGFSKVHFYKTPELIETILLGDNTNYEMPHDACFLLSAII